MQRRIVVAVVAAVVVVAGVGTALALTGRTDDPAVAAPSTGTSSAAPSSTSTTPSTSTSANTTTPAAPSTSAGGTGGATPSGTSAPATPSVGTTAVTISYAGWDPGSEHVQVNAYADVVESGGTCTLTVVDATGSDRRTATASAAADATTSVCDQLSVDGATMAAGTWTATVDYRSAAHTGASATTDVEVTR